MKKCRSACSVPEFDVGAANHFRAATYFRAAHVSKRSGQLALVLVSLFSVPCFAQSPGPDESLSALGGLLKPILLEHLPAPLYEKSTNWGHQEMAAHHVQWRGLRARIVKVPRNEGEWHKVTVTARNPGESFQLVFSDLKADGADRQTFQGEITLGVAVEMETQIWDKGLRLYSGSLKARLKLKMKMDCETILRLEDNKTLLPDAVFRIRVLKAEVRYDDLVVEHLAGIGGTGAKVLGEALHSGLKQWKPSLERNLLAKANAAVVKAADTREVRLSLGKLFDVKKK